MYESIVLMFSVILILLFFLLFRTHSHKKKIKNLYHKLNALSEQQEKRLAEIEKQIIAGNTDTAEAESSLAFTHAISEKTKDVTIEPEQERKNSNRIAIVLVAIIIFVFAAVIIRINTPTSENKTARSAAVTATQKTTSKATSKPTATPKVTNTPKPTKTPKPTATPKPTDTPVPDFATMDAVKAATELAEYFCDGMSVADVSKTNNYITIQVHTDSFLTAKMFVRDCCRSTLNIAQLLFTNVDFEELNVKFSTEGRDQYGNSKTVTAVTIRLTRETASKINYEYMINNLGSTTDGFLRITDSYFVHPDLFDGVY